MKRKCLVVVDMQNDFITGVLGNEQCRAIVSNVVAKMKKCIEEGYEIFYTMDTHDENYLETQEGRNLPVKHCIRGTEGWKIIPEVADILRETYVKYDKLDTEHDEWSEDAPDYRSFEKNSFGSKDLYECFDCNYDLEEVLFIGVCTDICVISNAMLAKTCLPETEIIVDSSCCAGVTQESHENALNAMRAVQITVL